MTIYSYVAKTVEQGGWTGVCRFSESLRKVFSDPFPHFQEITEPPRIDVTCIASEKEFILGWHAGDVVITDNHLSLNVPPEIRTVVVHHGCAQTHFERDATWRTANSILLVNDQRKMLELPNRVWVAPSAWVAAEFRAVTPNQFRKYHIIPHWVEPIPRLYRHKEPVIIGDWRGHNKGANVWKKLAERCAQWDFRPLNFRDDTGRREQYGTADLYLCLSLSEGGSYSMCDAEAASLPIVSTDVGNYREFDDCEVIPWRERDNLDLIAAAIDRKLHQGRRKPSFYEEYTFEDWKRAWEEVIQ